MRSSTDGFALAVVLLVSLVALGAAVGAAAFAVSGARQVAAGERRSTTALLVAESGLNSLMARINSAAYAFDDSTDASIDDWLTRTGLNEFDIATDDGSVVGTVSLSALNEDASAATVTLRSEGVTPDGATRVVLQTYELDEAATSGGPGLFANAALITQERLDTNSAKSELIGRGEDPEDWEFPDKDLSDALPGDYFRDSDDTLYRVVEDLGDGDYTLDPINPDGDQVTDNEADIGTGTLIPFAVAETLSPSIPNTFAVAGSYLYEEGTEIRIGDVGEATVTSVDDENGTITVDWAPTPTETVEEGTPIRTIIPSAITENGNCPTGPNTGTKLPQGCETDDLSNIFEKTFGECDQKCLYDIATGTYEWEEEATVLPGEYYGPEADEDWPTGDVTGVTWIDGAQTGSFNSGGGNGPNNDTSEKGLCGDGVVVLNTGTYDTEGEDFDGKNSSINLNVSDCEFNGILYVVGDLGIQGNLESFSGSVIVQTENGTKVQGGGKGPDGAAKATYDPIAIRNALAGIPRGGGETILTGLLGPIPSTYRFGR